MALIDTQTFPITRQRLTTALHLIPNQPNIFSGGKMREARVQFISGKNVLASIRGWLLAANVIKSERRDYFLTDFGKRLAENDIQMKRTGSWWCFHINICFSVRGEPYCSFFRVLGERADWEPYDQTLTKKIAVKVDANSVSKVANASIEKNLEGVVKMFMGDGPLTDLGLIERRNENGKLAVRQADAIVQDETIIYALALARHRHYPSAHTIHFSELVDIGFNHFLCMSVNTLRKRLRNISRNRAWEDYLSFIEGKDLDSIKFGDLLNPNRALLHLLQEADDTWI